MQVHIVYHQHNANTRSPNFCSVMAAVSNVNTANGLALEHGAEIDTISFNFQNPNEFRTQDLNFKIAA